jgi:hypothetical protein
MIYIADRKVWRYLRGNQKPSIVEDNSMANRRRTKRHTSIYKTKDWATQTHKKTGMNSGAPEG